MQNLVTDVNALLVCEFDPPISLTLPVAEQVALILDRPSIVHCNRRMAILCSQLDPAKMYGHSLGSIIGKSRNDSEPLREAVRDRLLKAYSSGYQCEGISARWIVGQEQRDFQVSYHGIVQDDHLQRLVILHHDETERRRQEHLIFDVAQQLSEIGEDGGETDLLGQLVAQLARQLGVDMVLVGELVSEQAPQDSIHSLGCWYRDGLVPELTYTLAGGPCAEVTGHRICSFPAGVRERFPHDRMLGEMDAEAYVGVPLYGRGGKQIGILCLLHSQPLADLQLAHSLLTIFSMRAAAEVDRIGRNRTAGVRAAHRQIFFDDAPHGMHVVELFPPMPAGLSVPQQVRWFIEYGRYVECNAAYARLMGKQHAKELIDQAIHEVDVSYDLAGSLRFLIDNGYQLRDHPVKCTLPDGRERWLSYTISAVNTPAGLSRLLTFATDITERMLYTRQIEHRARHDSLTGLPNRAFFYEVIGRELERDGVPFAVFILDLDGFKEINDTLGHEMGDHLLREIGPRLQHATAGSEAMVARLGGDEFAILLPDYNDFSAVQRLADTVIDAVRRPFRVLDLDLVVGASMGIALYPEQGGTVSALMRCADIAMYQAKRHSSQIELYRSDLDHYTIRRLALMMDIRQAIGNGELRLVYQPIVELESRNVLGFEALLRWQHPQHGLLSPAEFIPLVELTDMIDPLTWWVLENATAVLQSWRIRGWDFQLSVNISTRNMSDNDFADRLKSLLRERCLGGESLVLEITESALMADPEQARRVLLSLAEAGVRSSIDDYGTGYSSLAYLRSLPIHTLKIDRTFISQMLESEQDHIIAASTVQLAHNLGLEVIAEGIESDAVLRELRAMGCDRGQGYFIARPLADGDIAEWVSLHQRLRLNLQD